MIRNNRRAFILSEYISAEENSTGYFWSKIINRLEIDLDQVDVITYSSSNTDNKSKNNTVYHKLITAKYNKNNFLSRALGQLKQSFRFISEIKKHATRGDVVMTGTNPAILLTLIPLARFFMGFRWVLLVHDVYPDNLVPAGILRKNSICYKILDRYFSWVYSQAELIFVIGRDMQTLISKKNEDPEKVCYIPNWVDENDIQPIEKNSSNTIKNIDWKNKIVFQFFGNMGRVQGIDNLINAIKLTTSPLAAFIFIGSGAKAEIVQEFVKSHPNKNVAYLGPMEQSEKNEGLSACDVALVTLEKGMVGLGVPSKAYFSMAADRPLLAVMENDAEIALTVQENNIGWVCEPGNPEALASLIDEICFTCAHRTINSPRLAFKENYTERILLDKFSEKISKLFKSSNL